MTAGAGIDVLRLIRIATAAGAILAGYLAYVAAQPETDALTGRLDAARAELGSDDVAFAEIGRLRAERDLLRARYADALRGNPEAVFLRDLGAATRRHGVGVVSTSASREPAGPAANGDDALFTRVDLTVELRGAYRDLLATIVELSLGTAIARVGGPSFRRTGTTLVASVPVTLFEPLPALGRAGTGALGGTP
jgi:hypothetical protein